MPKTCSECGKQIKQFVDNETGILTPTCVGCKEQFINEEIANKLQEHWEKFYTNKKSFFFDFSGRITLTQDEIWPDGDAPENPTIEDVKQVIKQDVGSFSPIKVITQWNLDDCINMHITEKLRPNGKQ